MEIFFNKTDALHKIQSTEGIQSADAKTRNIRISPIGPCPFLVYQIPVEGIVQIE